jgi:hypothetical protein
LIFSKDQLASTNRLFYLSHSTQTLLSLCYGHLPQ